MLPGQAVPGDIPVAGHAPSHCQWLNFPHPLHRLDGPVALLTLDAYVHVGSVVEIYEVGKVVDFGPTDGPRGLARISFEFAVQRQRVIDFLNLC